MKVAYRVQHALGRDAALSRLAGLLTDEFQVVVDDKVGDPNPWRCYRRCLEDLPADATHVVVLQDDSVPCADFHDRVEEAIREKPDDVLSLFVGGLPGRTRVDFLRALKREDRWAPIYFREIHHVVALVWPASLAAEFLEWFAKGTMPSAATQRADDAVVGYWARTTRRVFWATVPCLVEHPDDMPSTIGRPWGKNDRGRRAVHFAG